MGTGKSNISTRGLYEYKIRTQNSFRTKYDDTHIYYKRNTTDQIKDGLTYKGLSNSLLSAENGIALNESTLLSKINKGELLSNDTASSFALL